MMHIGQWMTTYEEHKADQNMQGQRQVRQPSNLPDGHVRGPGMAGRFWSRSLTILPAAALAAGTLTWNAAASAQTVPTREEILRAPMGVGPEERPVQIDSDDGIERSPCPLADPQFASLRFTLTGVVFQNAEGIDLAALDPSWRGLVGQEVPVSAICDIRDRAGTILRQAGYLAAVQVPVQTIENGQVQLQILAARLSGVQIRGDAGNSERQLAAYLDQLSGDGLFNVREAERYLLLANSIPGLSARLTLRPVGAPGELVGEVTVVRTPAIVSANVQNFGSTAVGRFSGIVRAQINGLTGLGDQTTLAVYSTAQTREQQVVQGAHEFRVGREGLTLGSSVTYAWTSPTLGGGLDIDTESLIWSSYARFPLTLRQSRSLWVGGGFDWIDQDVNAVGTLLSRDHLRILWANLAGDWIDPSAFSGAGGYSPAEPRWSARLNVEARQGLGFLGASSPCGPTGAACFGPGAIPIGRIDADPSAFVLRAEGELAVRPTRLVTLVVAPRAQYSNKALLSYEEFSAGNFTVGRGYDPGTLTGDRGLGVTTEFRIGSIIPQTNRDLAIQPFAFFDAAWTWNKDAVFAGLNPQRLYSAGGGIRAVFGNVLRVDAMVAEPLRRTGFIPVSQPTRFLISITTQFGVGR